MKVLKWTFSGKFERFYRRQIEVLGLEPQFELNGDLNEGEYAQTTPDGRIQMRRNMPKKVAEDIAAHEIMHLVLDKEGYPSVETAPEKGNWAGCRKALANMLSNAIIERRLAKLGFDRQPLSKRNLRQTWQRLRELSPAPSQQQRQRWLVWVFGYVGKTLELSDPVAEEFSRRFDKRFPLIAQEGQLLLSFIREHGFDTPVQCLEILQEVFQRYGLSPHLAILSPRSL